MSTKIIPLSTQLPDNTIMMHNRVGDGLDCKGGRCPSISAYGEDELFIVSVAATPEQLKEAQASGEVFVDKAKGEVGGIISVKLFDAAAKSLGYVKQHETALT